MKGNNFDQQILEMIMNIAEAEVSLKDEPPQAEADNMNKMNTSPEETEDSTSSNQRASVTAVEVKPYPPTPINVTLK